MNQSLEKLEVSVYRLAQKFETVVSENKRLHEEIGRLKNEQAQQKNEHQAAVDELSEALLVQVGKLKEDLQSKIDTLLAENHSQRELLGSSAERIRALGHPAPGSYAAFGKLSSLPDAPATPPKALEMVRILVEGHEAVARTARGMLDLVDDADDEPTTDLLTQRLTVHEQTAWMLRSLLEE